MTLLQLRNRLGAKASVFLMHFKTAAKAAPRPNARDRTSWRRGLIRARESDDVRPVMLDPLHAMPPDARLIDLTGIVTGAFDGTVQYFEKPVGAGNITYTVPDGHIAVIKHWGFTAHYDAADFTVNEVYRYVTFSLLGKNANADGAATVAGAYRPYYNLYRPGPAESICRNAHLVLRPGDEVTPVMEAKVGYSPGGFCDMFCRLWGWQWETGDPGMI